jgi:hypothetical protein
LAEVSFNLLKLAVEPLTLSIGLHARKHVVLLRVKETGWPSTELWNSSAEIGWRSAEVF